MIYKRCLDPACGKKLTSKLSQRRGYGRTCWEKRRPRRIGELIRTLPLARRAAEIAAGQLAIDEEVDGGDL